MNSEDSSPSECEAALVISCGTATPEQVILNIIGVKSPCDDVTEQNPNSREYPWSFETKYYSAEINLFALKEKDQLDAGFCSSIKAIVFYFDSQKESSFDDVLSWMPIVKDIEAEVQLMVWNNSADESDDLIGRKKFLNWCVKNQYELIELNPSSDSDDEEGTVRSAKGYARVIEALQSHTWANLILKNETDRCNDAIEDKKVIEDETAKSQEANASPTKEENRESSAASNAEHCKKIAVEGKAKSQEAIKVENIEYSAASNAEQSRKVAVEGEELELEQQWLSDVFSGDDPEGKSLEALFGKFVSMKEKARGLAEEERKKYAEKVAIAFWEAMGGDKEEIEGLDDLED